MNRLVQNQVPFVQSPQLYKPSSQSLIPGPNVSSQQNINNSDQASLRSTLGGQSQQVTQAQTGQLNLSRQNIQNIQKPLSVPLTQ